MRKHFEMNENENRAYQNLWDVVINMGNLWHYILYQKIRIKISELSFHLRNQKKNKLNSKQTEGNNKDNHINQ